MTIMTTSAKEETVLGRVAKENMILNVAILDITENKNVEEAKKDADTVGDEGDFFDFDDILGLVGARGRYQKLLLYAFLTPVIFITPFFQFSSIFMVSEPDHWCHVPGQLPEHTMEAWRNLTIPMEMGLDGIPRYSQCQMYDGSGESVDCRYGWDFDRSDYVETMVSKFNWVCEKSKYSTYALTVNAIGNAVGTILFGRAADKFGRKSVFFFICFLAVFFRAVSVFTAENFGVFLFHQFIIGAAAALTYSMPTMLACEVSDKDYRAWIYSYTWGVWVFGFSALPIVVWLTKRWDAVGLATSLPGILIFVYWSWVLESPRWLLSQGKVEECGAVLETIGARNGVKGDFSKKLKELIQSHYNAQVERKANKRKSGEQSTGFYKSFRLLKNLLVLTAMCSANQVVNYGLTLNTSNLYGNQFMNYFLLAIIEVPASGIGGFLANKFGRRWTQVLFYSVCMISCGGSAIYYICHSHASPYILIGLIIVAKFAITVTFLVSYLQITEIFPTSIRSTCSGVSNTVASVLNTLTPFVVHAGKSNLPLTYLVFTSILCVTALASAFLPETNNRKLAETVQEANVLGKGDKFWSLRARKNEG